MHLIKILNTQKYHQQVDDRVWEFNALAKHLYHKSRNIKM